MVHNFITKSHNLSELFINVKTLATFMNNLEKQSKLDPTRYDPLKYVGDGFEFFIEVFLKLHPNDNRIGLYKYTPIQMNDNGVDGVAYNINGEKAVIQIKYRSNKQELLSSNKDHLANLFSDGMLTHNVVSDNLNPKNYRHYVFTTAKGLHFYTDNEMFKNKVKCFGFDDLKQFVDKNIPFWNNARQLVSSL